MRDIRAHWCSSPDKLCVNHAACNQKDSCIYLIAPQKLIKPKVKKKKKEMTALCVILVVLIILCQIMIWLGEIIKFLLCLALAIVVALMLVNWQNHNHHDRNHTRPTRNIPAQASSR